MTGGRLQFTVLGCGSSGGVPRADGDWGACDPHDPRNRRSRCSLLVRRRSDLGPEHETTVLVDTSPDLRLQTAAAGARRLDAVLLTHDHADQSHGIDDVRAFALKAMRRIPVHMDQPTNDTMLNRFRYIFRGEAGYPAICDDHLIPPHGLAWAIDGPSGPIPVLSFDQDHGGMRSVGYRFGDLAYSSDVVDLPPSAFEALAGVRVWIVDALRYRPHPTHAHLERTLDWIKRVRPQRAILTNMHIDLDFKALSVILPRGVEPAFDGMTIDLAMD